MYSSSVRLWGFVELGLHHSLYFLVHGSDMAHQILVTYIRYDYGFQGRALKKNRNFFSPKSSEYLRNIHKVSNYIGREKSKLMFAGNKFVSPDSGPDKI